jgi:hypothetical protein
MVCIREDQTYTAMAKTVGFMAMAVLERKNYYAWRAIYS